MFCGEGKRPMPEGGRGGVRLSYLAMARRVVVPVPVYVLAYHYVIVPLYQHVTPLYTLYCVPLCQCSI